MMRGMVTDCGPSTVATIKQIMIFTFISYHSLDRSVSRLFRKHTIEMRLQYLCPTSNPYSHDATRISHLGPLGRSSHQEYCPIHARRLRQLLGRHRTPAMYIPLMRRKLYHTSPYWDCLYPNPPDR